MVSGSPSGRDRCSMILRAQHASLLHYPHFSGNKDTMQFWNELEGQTLDRLYPLRRLVRSEGRSAWFETATGEDAEHPRHHQPD